MFVGFVLGIGWDGHCFFLERIPVPLSLKGIGRAVLCHGLLVTSPTGPTFPSSEQIASDHFILLFFFLFYSIFMRVC